MATIHEEVIVIKISKLVKDVDNVESAVTDELLTTVEQVTQELAGEAVIVEVEKA